MLTVIAGPDGVGVLGTWFDDRSRYLVFRDLLSGLDPIDQPFEFLPDGGEKISHGVVLQCDVLEERGRVHVIGRCLHRSATESDEDLYGNIGMGSSCRQTLYEMSSA